MEELKVTRSDHSVEVSFERPSRANALSESMVDCLLELVDDCMRNPPRLFVLSGNPRYVPWRDLVEP
jgi:enoyl-CoA hydratase/carnithine racemase